MKGILIMGGLFVLLLFSFGCLGAKEKPSGAQPASALSIADISPQANQNDASVLPLEDVVNETVASPAGAGSSVSVSDVDVVQMNDPDVISDQDVVGPE